MARGIADGRSAERAALRIGAAAYFARHGFDRASMTGAAAECGVSKALLYHYYDSKEALLFDILNAHLSDLAAAVEAKRPLGLAALIQVILAVYENADAEHKLQLDALQTLPADLQGPLIQLQRQLVKTMSEAIKQERPHLSGDRLRAVTMSVFGILNWFYMWHRPDRGLTRTQYAELAADFVKGGISAL